MLTIALLSLFPGEKVGNQCCYFTVNLPYVMHINSYCKPIMYRWQIKATAVLYTGVQESIKTSTWEEKFETVQRLTYKFLTWERQIKNDEELNMFHLLTWDCVVIASYKKKQIKNTFNWPNFKDLWHNTTSIIIRHIARILKYWQSLNAYQ